MLLSKTIDRVQVFFYLVLVHKITQTPHPNASECHQYLVSTFGQSTRGVDEPGNQGHDSEAFLVAPFRSSILKRPSNRNL